MDFGRQLCCYHIQAHFKKAKFASYIKNAFDYVGYCNSKFNTAERNMLIRLKITLAKAIEHKIKLSRFIVVILDNNLIQFPAFVNKGMANLLGEWFEWLASCYNELCEQRKNLLPSKAARPDYPQIYFVAPLRHNNFSDNEERKILMNCMEAMAKIMENIRIIKMMELWNPNDLDLVSHDGILTADGMRVYWASVDKAVAFNVKKHDEFLSRRGLWTSKITGSLTTSLTGSVRKCSGAEEDMRFFKRMRNKKSLPTATLHGRKLLTPLPFAK